MRGASTTRHGTEGTGMFPLRACKVSRRQAGKIVANAVGRCNSAAV
jgi:hypothetical protein